MPLQLGPLTPTADDDPLAWHAMPGELPVHGMRRRRRLDLVRDPDGAGALLLDAMFRDTYVSGAGGENIVHEYQLRARLDADLVVTAVSAEPRVLPWTECPMAAASAGRLVGTSVRDLRDRVRQDFKGISTCTHLNDLLRSLATLPALVAELPAP
jgi:hypothetical protein